MKIWIVSFLLFLLFVPSAFAEAPSTSKRELAIVIDDLGNSMKGTEEILNLPIFFVGHSRRVRRRFKMTPRCRNESSYGFKSNRGRKSNEDCS